MLFLVPDPFSTRTMSDKLREWPINTCRVMEMSKPTGSLWSDPEQAGSAIDVGEGRIPVPEEDVQFEPGDDFRSVLKRPGEGPVLDEILRWLARSLAVLAVLSGVALLCVDATPLLTSAPAYIAKTAFRCWAVIKDVRLSALPLLLAGSSYLVLQAILRPRPVELLKRLMLGMAFLLWGVVQLMPHGGLETELGSLVIALYVVDLVLIVWTDLKKDQPRVARSRRNHSSNERAQPHLGLSPRSDRALGQNGSRTSV
jgi:hypothetical protein